MSENRRKVTLDGKYELGGGTGSWAKSRERGVCKGECRMIDGILMYAWTIYPRGFCGFGKPEVNWCPVDSEKNTNEELRRWLR